ARGRGRGASNGAGGDGSAGRRSCGIVHVGRRAEVAELPATMREIHSGKGATMFESVEEVQQRFRDARYIASRRVSTVVFLAARMGRPVLIEGPAGVGKTELAKTLSEITSRPLIRLQCYEGLDEGKALYEWKYAKQLLYTQLLRDRIGELIADAPSLPDAVAKIAGQEDAFFSFRFLSPRPLLSAIQAEQPVDWARSLVILNARELDPGIVESTLTMLVKHEKDLERVKGSLDKVLAE